MSTTPEIAILIPCFNEERTIAQVIAECRATLPQATLYVYDNNSTDRTAEIAREAGAVVRYERRQGKGAVVRSMFRSIEADCYVMVDGDDTYSLTQLPQMCQMVLDDEADMVIGDRLSTTYDSQNTRPFHSLGNRLVRGLINHLFHSHITDIMTGLRVMNRRFVKSCPVMADGFELETEMTIFALDAQFRLSEVAIEYRNRPEGSESKLNTYTDGLRVLRTIVRLFRDYRPLAFFSSLAMVVGAVALLLFLPVFVEYLHTGLVPRFPTLIVSGFMGLAALLLLFCGVVLDVITNRHRQLTQTLI